MIREQDPLKQGLKQFLHSIKDSACIIREQDPLKQGLKLIMVGEDKPEKSDSRARSTKTRIETNYSSWCECCKCWIREQDPLKQGLKQREIILCQKK